MSNMELLAPAGNMETFLAALEGGADAVYVGAPGFNARNLARDIRLEEIGAMIQYAHNRGKKLYLAFNSLLLEREIKDVIRTLAVVERLAPDALIVQDYGLIRLVRKYFPSLVLHGSTLMTATNSDAVNFLASLGCERVVLARELTLKEIDTINHHRHGTELEVFIHGAMCFSYSGLCLFSSYLGGKSGLRGRCVQPCRRNYTVAGGGKGKHSVKKGPGQAAKYLFSMNDLSGLEAIPELRRLEVSSLKIEGRLRTAHYIRSVVSAYRMALDCTEGDWQEMLPEARKLIDGSMSRKTASGYFFSPQPQEAIVAHHSGNMGLHLGRFTAVKHVGKKNICRFVLKHDLEVGDRIRLHSEPSGERVPFTLKSLFVDGAEQQSAGIGTRVSFALPDNFIPTSSGHVEVYKVDRASSAVDLHELEGLIPGVAERMRQNNRGIGAVVDSVCEDVNPGGQIGMDAAGSSELNQAKKSGSRRFLKDFELWLKVDSVRNLGGDFLSFPFARYLLTMNSQSVAQVGKIKGLLGKKARQVTWSLPPVILVNELGKWRKQVRTLCRSGFRSFQLGHLSQVELFGEEKVYLMGDYTLNILNSQAAGLASEVGLAQFQASIETDREALAELAAGLRVFREVEKSKHLSLGLTVYGAPALYTSRIAADHFRYDQELLSPKNEGYVVLKKEGSTQTFPSRPFSLLQYLPELQEMGLKYGVVDLSGRQFVKRELEELAGRLSGKGKFSKLPTFNYLGKLI